MSWKRRPMRPQEIIIFEEGVEYTARQLEQIGDQILREHAKKEDPKTGKKRGIGGTNPILFEEHLYQRERREITNVNGVPEPGLVSGMYWKAHPEGRKINPDAARKRGASYFR